MHSQMIRPSNSAAVKVPSSMPQNPNFMGGGRPQMGGMNQQQQQQNAMSPGDMIKNMLNSSLQNTSSSGGTGGFNWGRYDSNSYEDEALRSLMSTGNTTQDNSAYFVDRVAAAMQHFMQQIYNRTGKIFEEFKKSKEAFKFSTTTSIPCNVRSTFVSEVDRLHEFTKLMAIHGAPFFGYRLICILKETNQDAFTEKDYLDSVTVAVRNVLFLEMANWLTTSRNGRLLANNLPNEIAEKLGNLNNLKEITNVAFETFSSPNPYVNLEFKRHVATRPDYELATQPVTTFVAGDLFNYRETDSIGEGMQEIEEMIKRNAAAYRGEVYKEPNKINPLDWNQERKDFTNLNTENKIDYNLRRYFVPIDKPNHYFIPESDWKNVKHGFRKHPEMGPEETVMPGTFRVVIINLDEEDPQWFSTIVRNERIDIVMILSNPNLLLPGLSDEKEEEKKLLNIINAKDLVKNNDFVELEEVVEATKDIPFINVGEKIVSNNSAELEATILTVNETLSKNIVVENAVGFNTTVKDSFTCKNTDDKNLLMVKLPFMFSNSKKETDLTLYQCYRALYNLFTENVLDGELMTFIDTKLTEDFNNWLVNSLGYDADEKGKDHLSVDSIIRDFREISQVFKEMDLSADSVMHSSDYKKTYLGKQLGMFELNDPTEQTSIIGGIKEGHSLTLTKDIFVTVINNKGGPLYIEPDVPIVVKRSRFPELFQMMEEGYKSTMGDDSIKITDKIICYGDSGNMWLFNYSLLDRSVATLRHISRRKPLVLLSQD